MLKRPRRTRLAAGFSLIELMMAIAILAILMGIAVPSFQTFIQNSKIRNAAESISNGLQKARAEAVARNTNIAFVLGTDSAWSINVVSPASQIEARSSNEGSQGVTRTVVPDDATTITFNGFGNVVANAASLTQVNLTATGGTQTLRITIGAGGATRMCDPNLTTGSSPRAC